MAARKKLSKLQFENLAAFRYALRQFLRFSEEATRDSGVWMTLRTAIETVARRYEGARIRVEVGDRTAEISGKPTADGERLLEQAQRMWEAGGDQQP